MFNNQRVLQLETLAIWQQQTEVPGLELRVGLQAPDQDNNIFPLIIAKKDSKVNLHYFDGDLLFFLFGDDYIWSSMSSNWISLGLRGIIQFVTWMRFTLTCFNVIAQPTKYLSQHKSLPVIKDGNEKHLPSGYLT